MNTGTIIDEARQPIEVILKDSNDFLSPFLSSLITIVCGVVVFIIGQYLFSLWIQPLQKFKELKQEVSYQLTFYARYYMNVAIRNIDIKKSYEEYEKASDDLRMLASKVRGFSQTISWIHFGIPKKKVLFEVSKELIGLSNGFFANQNTIDRKTEENEKRVKRINEHLNLCDE